MPALRPARRSPPPPHRLVAGLFGVGVVLALASMAQATPVGLMAGGFAGGEWMVKRNGDTRSHCALDAQEIVHGAQPPAPGCRSNVVRDDGQNTVVRWTCNGGDQGQTSIRRDTDGLLMVESQGIRDRLPFRERSEWQRTGDCAVARR